MVKAPLFERLAIIGPGLIGSSLLRRGQQDRNLARHLIAVDHNPAVIARVQELGIADLATTSLQEGVQEADMVILCVPTGAVKSVAEAALPHMRTDSILSDVASVRGTLGPEISALLPPSITYIPAHPLAGTEHSGPDAGFATLFEDRWCLLTPSQDTSRESIIKTEQLWQKCGARTRHIDAHYHDHICAVMSHLPHLLAFTICDTADRISHDLQTDILEYAASGFRDFTRIAASDPVMWRDIFLANREILLQTLERFQAETAKMAEAIRTSNAKAITDRVERSRRIRQKLIANRQA